MDDRLPGRLRQALDLPETEAQRRFPPGRALERRVPVALIDADRADFDAVAADGTPLERPVTLMGALLGWVALALTVIGSRNLPGLVELGFPGTVPDSRTARL